MELIARLLDAAKEKAGIESDYRLAKVIGITHSVISGYRAGKSMPNEKILSQLCALSGDDPMVVAAEIQSARSKDPEAKSLWLMVAARLRGGATTAILSVCFALNLIALSAQDALAVTVQAYESGQVELLYIVSSTFLTVGEFLLVRLRQTTGLLRLSNLLL